MGRRSGRGVGRGRGQRTSFSRLERSDCRDLSLNAKITTITAIASSCFTGGMHGWLVVQASHRTALHAATQARRHAGMQARRRRAHAHVHVVQVRARAAISILRFLSAAQSVWAIM